MNGNYIAAAALALIALSKRQGSMGKRGPKGRDWTEEQISMLGTMSDREIAERLGVSIPTVYIKRKDLGISADDSRGRKKIQWTEEWISMLGTMSDIEIAERLGISISAVFSKRSELGIPAYDFTPGRKKIQWTEEWISMLGTMPDIEVAERLGINKMTVLRKRQELGIPTYDLTPSGPKGRYWTGEQIGLLGTMSDREIAERLGISIPSVFTKRKDLGIPSLSPRISRGRKTGPKGRYWTEEQIGLLGTMSDREIAERLGISTPSVLRKREELGIPAYDLTPSGPKRRDWTEEQIKLFGTMSGSDIAKKLGISLSLVNTMKKKLREEGLIIKNLQSGRKRRS